jgi:hypothetical protein
MQYLTSLPKSAPAGSVLVHNQVFPPSHRLGSRGSRAWLDRSDTPGYVVCDCGWASELGPHYRVGITEPA